jgi:gas vesicle protein
MVLSAELLGRPYQSEEARQIAILKQVAENLRSDIDKLSQDNQALAVSGMLMNQVLKAVLLELDKTPVLAKNLSEKGGVAFNHINFDKGRIALSAEESVVTVKVRLGVFVRTFNN